MVARLPSALLEEAGNFQKLFQRILKIFWKQASSQDIVKTVENIFGSGHLPSQDIFKIFFRDYFLSLVFHIMMCRAGNIHN